MYISINIYLIKNNYRVQSHDWKQSTKVNQPLAFGPFLLYSALLGYASGDHSRGCYAHPSIWQECTPPSITGVWPVVFTSVSGQLLDSKALCRQLRVVLHHNSILHHGHHPPWLGICFRISLRGVSTKVTWPSAYGLILLCLAHCTVWYVGGGQTDKQTDRQTLWLLY